MSAASQPGRNVASARMIVAVSAPTAYRPNTPAPPNMPAPTPAFLPFSPNSSFASSISWRTSVVVWSESCLSSSLVGRSLTSLPALRSGICASEGISWSPSAVPGSAGLRLELLGALEAPPGLGVAGARLDAALAAALVALAGHRHRHQRDEREDDDDQDHDQDGAHGCLLPVRDG